MALECDARARQVAQLAQGRERADFAVLFGSRARGDHDELESDIDVLLVLADEPDDAGKAEAVKSARQAAQAAYGRAVPVQLVWRSLETFRRNRRYANSLESNAMREGIVMPRDPSQYRAGDYEDEETEYEYNWSNYDNRMLHAELHLDMLQSAYETGKHDLMIGQQAQSALEHGLKALLEAHGVGQGQGYRNTHDIGELLGNVRYRIAELADFRLAIDPAIYTEYAGGGEYQETRRQPLLTGQADYLERTVGDVEFIIRQARDARARDPQDG